MNQKTPGPYENLINSNLLSKKNVFGWILGEFDPKYLKQELFQK